MERRNPSGLPLAGSEWLVAHHRAKLPERRAFSEQLAALGPSRVLDLGCGPGLWLDELDKLLPPECEFVGVDSDEATLSQAAQRAERWQRPVTFECLDLESATALPDADLTLLFNVSPYLPQVDALLADLAQRGGNVAVRQYDGAALRFGPIETQDRAMIEDALRAAVLGSGQFRHYDLDRMYTAIEQAPFRSRDVSFELFARTSPFPAEFMEYYTGTLEWTLDLLSDAAGERLRAWWERRKVDARLPAYFVEVDLVALLS
jgi:SAM-dependent methyltransferase